MALETLTTTDNFSQAHVDRWLREQLLEIGERDVIFERFAMKAVMPQGLGTTVSWLRYNRLDLPTGTLTEGTAPANTQLGLTRVSTSTSQFGLVVVLSDRLQIETNHDVLRVAVGQVAETIAQLRDKIIQDALIGGTNVLFSGASNTARSGLAAGDVLDTEDILRANSTLETTDDVAGRAPRFRSGPASGKFAGVMHPNVALDLRQDSVWNNSAIRQDIEALRDTPFGVIDWEGIRFFVSNYLPEFTNQGDAFSAADDEHDAVVAFNDGGGSLGDFISVTITRKNLKRGFEEGIYDVEVSGDLTFGDDADVDVDVPSNTSFVYNVYIGDDTALQATATSNQTLESENVAANAQVTITDTSGTVSPPVQPAAGVEVFATYLFGEGAYGSVDMAGGALSAGFAQRGRTKDDPLDQLTKVGAKMFYAALILNDNFLVRIESASNFS